MPAPIRCTGKSVEQHGARFARPGTLVSNGPFRLGEWVVQSHIRLLRNPHYRDDAHTTLNEVWYYPVENAEAELNRYRAGELDLTETRARPPDPLAAQEPAG